MIPEKYEMDMDELNPAIWEFIKQESAAVPEPPGLKDRLRAAVAAEPTPQAASPKQAEAPGVRSAKAQVSQPEVSFWRRYFLMGAVAALALFSAGLAGIMHDECPYILSCIEEHNRSASGKNPLLNPSHDPKTLGEYASAQVKSSVATAPILEQYMLKPVGAGKAEFASLKQYDAPDGVFVKYEGIGNEQATLLLQPWGDEEPEPWNKMTFKGRTFWATSHHGKSVASWKSKDGKLVLSLVTDHSLNTTLEMALAAGDQM